MDTKIIRDTRSAYIWTRVLSVPFWGLINMLSIILYKSMHISPLQITAILALKPMSAIFAPYWSQFIYQRSDRVVSNLVLSNILRYLPFLFLPWVEEPWVIIIAFGIYMTLYRGAIPAWMETFKCNLPEVSREKVVAYGSTIDYCGAALLPLLLGFVLDGYEYAWRWLFPVTALLGISSTWFLYRLPSVERKIHTHLPKCTINWNEELFKPWKQSWNLLRERTDFAYFQIGFMFGGAGLMVMQPALPIFFVDILDLSYTKMLLAVAVCKGAGFALTSPVWTKLFRKWDIYYLSGIVTILAAIFPLLMISSQYYSILLYVAYGLYGMMQAGSELSWHMSGPVFSKDKDSSIFSGINVLTVGLRGCVAPFVGAFLFSYTNSTVVMLMGTVLCLMAARHLIMYSRSVSSQAVNVV